MMKQRSIELEDSYQLKMIVSENYIYKILYVIITT